jgi:hypothetical protein
MVLLAVRGHLSRHDATATRGSTSFRARPRPSMCTDEAAHKRKKTIETSYQVRRRKHVESDPVRQIQKKTLMVEAETDGEELLENTRPFFSSQKI